jgi:hypothetical protein
MLLSPSIPFCYGVFMRRSQPSTLYACVVSRLSIPQPSTLVLASLIACVAAIATPLLAEQTPARVTQSVDNTVRTVLRGNVHPLALAQFDQGEAPPDLVLHRMLLVLKRSDQQEAALRGLIDDQQDKHSGNYHQWLAPEEFGARFGPADSDLAAVTNWLRATGFQVTQVSKGRMFVEFSGTAGLVKQYFGTAIHQYAVKGGKYWANSNNPSIPTALTPVVQGFASLNNFPRRPHHTVAGPLTENYHGGDGPLPLFTFNFNSSEFYGVGPSDFATIYNVQPLWNAGIDGTGQTIAIVGETNINIQDVRDFRNIFGLPVNDPQITLNGPDPGILQDGEETEAVLDVSWSGAVAKGAAINFVVSESTLTSAGTDLSAIYIVDQNFAPVMSESYGFCEFGLGNGGNAFFFTLWEQAAVQGITVLISSGDGGSAGCDNFDTESVSQFGEAVSGYASTPFNVSVGGTDFDQTPATAPNYWNATNNATTGESAKSYIPETTWNDSCAGFGLNGCTSGNSNFFDIVAGSGGPSNCAQLDASGNCLAGYAKPAWQTGTGVPNDGVRDQPDVSLFASDRFNGSFYILCEADIVSPCSLDPVSFLSVGGTSAAAPSFAGIMALVNQKTGTRQGNANYILYKLAAQKGNSCDSSTVALTGNSCLFYDITKGNNSVPCVDTQDDTGECGPAPAGGHGVLIDPNHISNPAWLTTAGYDMATGLGSVNVDNLVTQWNTAIFAASTTTLTNLSPVTITHGANVNVTVTVAAKSGSGTTPTGDVSLMGNPNGKPVGIDFFPLSGGVATFTTNLLPGGNYNVSAHYQGDGLYGGSDSAGMAVKVTAENSSVYMGNPPGLVVGQDQTTGAPIYGTQVVYGTGAFDQYLLRADVLNSQNPPQFCTTATFGEVACPTNTITFTDNGSLLDGGTFKLNSEGFVEDQGIQLTAGSHTIVATYNGDPSYNPSTTTATVTVAKATSVISNVQTNLSSANPGQQFTVSATVNTSATTNTSFGLAPTGTVSFFYNTTQLLGTVQLTPTAGNINTGLPASLAATLTSSIPIFGSYNITATYSGDVNYTAVTQSNSVNITVLPFSIGPIANVTIATPGPPPATTPITVTPLSGFTGVVTFTCTVPTNMTEASCSAASANITSASPVTTMVTINTSGPHQVAAVRPAATGISGFGVLAGVFVFAIPGIRRRKAPLALLLFGIVVLIASCGGGSGGSSSHTDPGTPAGTYTLNLSATGGGVSVPATFSVSVQ